MSMVELTLLALLRRVTGWGYEPIIATRAVAADADALRAFLTDPASHWRLADLPPRLRRRANVHVRRPRTARLVQATVRVGRVEVLVTWFLFGGRGSTEVDLAAQVEPAGMLVRLALLLGGRRWIRRRLDVALARLSAIAVHTAEQVVAPETVAIAAARTGARRR